MITIKFYYATNFCVTCNIKYLSQNLVNIRIDLYF